MTDAQEAFEAWTQRLVDAVAPHEDVLGIGLAGSGAEPERIDEWSDHDVIMVVRQDPERWRRDLSWLPDESRIVLRVKETEHGQIIVFADSHLIELAIATPEELADWPLNPCRVVLDRGGMAELFDRVAGSTKIEPTDAAREIGLFLAALYVGVGRDRRGETLAAGRFVRDHAVGHLLRAWRLRLPAQVTTGADRLDAHRRFEQAYPSASGKIADALAHRPEPAARELLTIAEHDLGAGWDEWPADAVQTIRERLGWSAGW